MTVMAMGWAWKVQGLTPAQKLALLKLADNANDQGICWPSIAHIAYQTGLAKPTVKRSIKSLTDAGLIQVEKRFDVTGKNKTNIYRLTGWLRAEQAGDHSDTHEGFTVNPIGDHSDTGEGFTVIPGTVNKNQPPIEPSKTCVDDVPAVFEHWRQTMGKNRAKVGSDQRTKIKARLDEGWSVDDLKLAIDGCAQSDFHMGQNPRRRRYDSIDLIFRNAGKVQEFIDLAGGSSSINAAKSWLEESNG